MYSDELVCTIYIKLENLLLQHVSLGRTVPQPVQKTVRRAARAQRDVWEDVFRAGGGRGVTNVSPSLTPSPPKNLKNLKLLIAKKKQPKYIRQKRLTYL